MKKFCESLREHTIKKKLLTKRNHMKMQKSFIFVKQNLKINILKIKNIVKL